MAYRYEKIKRTYELLDSLKTPEDNIYLGSTKSAIRINENIFGFEEDDIRRWIEASLNGFENDFSGKILEIGTGTGAISIPFFSDLKEAEIVCADENLKNMEKAVKRAELMSIENIEFMPCDIGYLPYDNESFDSILSLNGIYQADKFEEIMNECWRVLKKDGMFIGFMYVENEIEKADILFKRKGIYEGPHETLDDLRRKLWGRFNVVSAIAYGPFAVFRCNK